MAMCSKFLEVPLVRNFEVPLVRFDPKGHCAVVPKGPGRGTATPLQVACLARIPMANTSEPQRSDLRMGLIHGLDEMGRCLVHHLARGQGNRQGWVRVRVRVVGWRRAGWWDIENVPRRRDSQAGLYSQ